MLCLKRQHSIPQTVRNIAVTTLCHSTVARHSAGHSNYCCRSVFHFGMKQQLSQHSRYQYMNPASGQPAQQTAQPLKLDCTTTQLWEGMQAKPVTVCHSTCSSLTITFGLRTPMSRPWRLHLPRSKQKQHYQHQKVHTTHDQLQCSAAAAR
jgi:hypothetical protein